VARNATTFQKGVVTNPKGRPPKGQATAEILRAIGDLTYQGTSRTNRERAASVMWEQACAGNLESLKWIVERTEGKVPDTINQNVTGDGSHAVSDAVIQAVLSAYAHRE